MNHRRRIVAAALAAGLLGCGSGTPRTPITTTPPPPAGPAATAPPAQAERPTPEAPTLRLPELARPTSHTVDLTLDPSATSFSGLITIEIEVLKPTDHLWLTATEITVHEATLTVGGEALALEARPANKEFLALLAPRPLAPGPATLRLKYTGAIHPEDGDGIYTAKDGGDWYLYTQFESTSARQAFPCFDEPSYKVPWQVTIHAKKELVALSNTPVEAESDEPGGMKAVRFARTKPLPSYLVAFAVGPFELVDAGKTRSGTPIRIVTPRGRGNEVEYPVKSTGPILEVLEGYFGMPYPFEKLDIVAVAVFNAGAMENPGLVTYRQELVLTKPGEMTEGKQKRYAGITAHELAHQWFGNYVTLAWWDDTWLNEAFASWAGAKAMRGFAPEWDADVYQVGSKSRIMGADSLDSARAIRQPIAKKGDIEASFDGITYSKGEAVLNMIETWVGPEQFQKGVRSYLAKHAWGNATYADFVGAIAEVAGPEVTKVFDAFVLQSGVPLVKMRLRCEKGQAPRVTLEQQRYVPVGSEMDPARTWTVPICVRFGAGKQTGRACTVLGEARGELALGGTKPGGCPDWILPNEGGVGYYRTQFEGDLLDRLLRRGQKALTLAERLAVIGDLNALVAAGSVPIETTLGLVASFAKDDNPYIVAESADIVSGIDEVVPPELRPTYQKLIARLYGARVKQLGWSARPGEDDEIKMLRKSLLGLVATKGGDAAIARTATELAWKWLDDRKSVDPELVDVVLSIATYHGDRKLFDRLHEEARKATDRGERGRLLGALAAFTDPELVKAALEIVLTDEFPLRESMALLSGAWKHPQNRPVAYAWVTAHFDDIAGKLPAPFRKYMAYSFVALCDESKKPEIEKTFKAKIEAFDGGERVFSQAMEQLSLCAAKRAAMQTGVVAFLRKHK